MISHKKPDVAASWRKVKTRVVLYSVAVWMSSTCSVLRAQNGKYLFKTYCAICHESSAAGEARGPETSALKLMTPEHILQALETDAMKAQAAERSRVQRRVLAEYLSGKALGNASVERISRSAFCTNAAQRFTNALDGPAWNGWGAAITNNRFQPAKAAKLTPEDVSRLKLKWAFGYPGATWAGTQPTVVGGRVYVGTAEGDVYSLDAKTGCVHWTIEWKRRPQRHQYRKARRWQARRILWRPIRECIRGGCRNRQVPVEDQGGRQLAGCHYRRSGAVCRTSLRARLLAGRVAGGESEISMLPVPGKRSGPGHGERRTVMENVHNSGTGA